MKPEMHYGEDDCPVSATESFPKDAELHFENWHYDCSPCTSLQILKLSWTLMQKRRWLFDNLIPFLNISWWKKSLIFLESFMWLHNHISFLSCSFVCMKDSWKVYLSNSYAVFRCEGLKKHHQCIKHWTIFLIMMLEMSQWRRKEASQEIYTELGRVLILSEFCSRIFCLQSMFHISDLITLLYIVVVMGSPFTSETILGSDVLIKGVQIL